MEDGDGIPRREGVGEHICYQCSLVEATEAQTALMQGYGNVVVRESKSACCQTVTEPKAKRLCERGDKAVFVRVHCVSDEGMAIV